MKHGRRKSCCVKPTETGVKFIVGISKHIIHLLGQPKKFSKVVIFIRSFLQILYHSITTKVVAINIQALEE